MKQVVKIILIFAALIQGARAAPYLTCDPYPANADANLNVVAFVITITNPAGINPVTIQPIIGTSGTQNLFWDLAPLTNATYTVTAAAVNGYGQEGPQSDSFTFSKGVPAKVTGIKIIPTIPVPLP